VAEKGTGEEDEDEDEDEDEEEERAPYKYRPFCTTDVKLSKLLVKFDD